MPANRKPGVDWGKIEQRVRAGESYRSIADDYPISHAGIGKRARREGWKPSGSERWLMETLKTKTAKMLKNPQTVGERKIAAYGKRTPENAAQILKHIQEGVGPSLAARAVGIVPSTLAQWKKDDACFDKLIGQARAEFLGGQEVNIAKAGDRGDWRAASRLLEVAQETKEEWNPERKEHANIIVHLNIPRAPGQGGNIIEGEAEVLS